MEKVERALEWRNYQNIDPPTPKIKKEKRNLLEFVKNFLLFISSHTDKLDATYTVQIHCNENGSPWEVILGKNNIETLEVYQSGDRAEKHLSSNPCQLLRNMTRLTLQTCQLQSELTIVTERIKNANISNCCYKI